MAGETITIDKAAAVQDFINHHVLLSSQQWHPLPFLEIPLPGFLSVHGMMVVLGAALLVLVFALGYRRRAAVPTGVHNVLELFVLFVRDQIAIPNMGDHDGRRMTPLLCTFFFFVLVLNLLGLIPLFVTATGNINVTAGLASIVLGIMVFGTIVKNGPLGFVKAFIPHGVPWPVLILLIPIEFAGMFIKAFALMIRLFANMMAGHIVVLALLSLVVMYGLWALPAVALALAIDLLEVFVCFLQAYIFTLLSAMFIGQMYHPAH